MKQNTTFNIMNKSDGDARILSIQFNWQYKRAIKAVSRKRFNRFFMNKLSANYASNKKFLNETYNFCWQFT